MKTGKHAAKTPRFGRLLGLILTIALVVSLVLLGASFAKYTTGFESDYQQADTSDFYFTSDLLSETEGNAYSQVCAGLQNAEISFTLYNYQDELNYTESDISYTVQYKLRTSDAYTDYTTGTIPSGEKKSAPVTVPISGLNPTGTVAIVDIQVVSTAPYAKTLSASFTITERVATASMQVSDSAGSNAVTVTVTTGDTGGLLTITPPTGCIAEPASGLNNNAMQVKANASYTFVFLKTDPSQVYTYNKDTGFSYTLS